MLILVLAPLAAAEAAGKDQQRGLVPLFELHSLTRVEGHELVSGANTELGYDRAGLADWIKS